MDFWIGLAVALIAIAWICGALGFGPYITMTVFIVIAALAIFARVVDKDFERHSWH